jgi:hypothetical protein
MNMICFIGLLLFALSICAGAYLTSWDVFPYATVWLHRMNAIIISIAFTIPAWYLVQRSESTTGKTP